MRQRYYYLAFVSWYDLSGGINKMYYARAWTLQQAIGDTQARSPWGFGAFLPERLPGAAITYPSRSAVHKAVL